MSKSKLNKVIVNKDNTVNVANKYLPLLSALVTSTLFLAISNLVMDPSTAMNYAQSQGIDLKIVTFLHLVDKVAVAMILGILAFWITKKIRTKPPAPIASPQS